jgi:hypothetical protein
MLMSATSPNFGAVAAFSFVGAGAHAVRKYAHRQKNQVLLRAEWCTKKENDFREFRALLVGIDRKGSRFYAARCLQLKGILFIGGEGMAENCRNKGSFLPIT